MNALVVDKRRRRTTKPSIESLDERIAPASMHVAAVAAVRAEVRSEAAAEARARIETSRIEHQTASRALVEARLHRQAPAPSVSSNQVGRLVSIVNLGGSTTASRSGGATSSGGTNVSPAAITPVIMPVTPVTTTPTPSNSTLSPGVSPTLPPIVVPPTPTPPTSPPSNTNLPPSVSPLLGTIYQSYVQWLNAGQQGTFTSPTGAGQVEVQGTNVGIYVHDGNPADFIALGIELENLGMQFTDSDATYGVYAGFLPIAQLPALADLPQTPNLSPMLYPTVN